MIDALMHWFSTNGHLSIAAIAGLCLLFVTASFVPVPRTFLCLGVGAIFGWPAVFVILPSTICGGVLAFLAARYLLLARVRVFVASRERLFRIARAVDEEGWRLLALLQFASPVPNTVQNYLFAITSIRAMTFAIVSLVFSMPQIVLYVYIGKTGTTIFARNDLTMAEQGAMIAGGISAAIAFILVVKRIRQDDRFTRLSGSECPPRYGAVAGPCSE